MNMENLSIDGQGRLLPMNCVVVISEGVAKLRELPEHGEYKIVTHQGKVRRMRREEGEEF